MLQASDGGAAGGGDEGPASFGGAAAIPTDAHLRPAAADAPGPVPGGGSGDAVAGGSGSGLCEPPVFHGGSPAGPGSRGSSVEAAAEDNLILCAAIRELASEAAEIETTAMAMDRGGDAEQAVACYRQAAERLSKAAASCPDGNSDRAVLSRHAGEIMGRIVYLESLHGAPATTPLEEHIGSAQLEPLPDGGGGPNSWGKQAAGAAAVGGATGLLVLHAPLAAAALAVGAAYATTRQDKAGEAARSMGDMGLQAADRAKVLAEEHKVPEQLQGAVAKAREVDEQYGISRNAQAAAVSSWQSLRELDSKHQVSSRVGQGLATATAGVASATVTAAGWLARARGGGR